MTNQIKGPDKQPLLNRGQVAAEKLAVGQVPDRDQVVEVREGAVPPPVWDCKKIDAKNSRHPRAGGDLA